jgi:hypothetical protein
MTQKKSKRDLIDAVKSAKYDDDKIFGLLNNSAAIHQDIRATARRMDIEPPTIE